MKYQQIIAVFFWVLFFFLLIAPATYAARLFLGPASGSFVVDSTFDISVFLDSTGETVNAFNVVLSFPPDKLQLVSPTTGESIVGIWTSTPQFNNQTGIIQLQGGVPNGVNVSQGLISRLTFRVKRVGNAIVRFSDASQVLLNDGKGTDVLENTQSGVYNLELPPPAGPIVASETHQDQARWYPHSSAVLNWGPVSGYSGYSYMISDKPIDTPDNISEGISISVPYRNLSDGTHYFHIKALRDGVWGGITHFALNIDTSPPADFPVKISPSARTTSKNPIVIFETTDAYSGINHYEFKTVSLRPLSDGDVNTKPFFIEADGRQIINVGLGSYDIIVRAYDNAGNYREKVKRLDVVRPLFRIINGDGVLIRETVTLSWLWVFIILAVAMVAFGLVGFRVRRWHHALIIRRKKPVLPGNIKEKLVELRKYRQKYGKIAAVLILLTSFFFGHHVYAQQQVEFTPPFVSTVSRNISNEDIFYIGGRTDASDTDIIIYLQNLKTGETLSQKVNSGNDNEWFYRHNTFLTSGNYLLWTQTQIGDQMSPPSPQITLNVRSTAIQFGASRLSFETLYLIFAIILLLMVAGLITFIVFHAHNGRKAYRQFLKEVQDVEEAVRHGFSLLRRDVEAELAVIKKAKLNKALSEEEKRREEDLRRDLDLVEKRIGKEILDVEKLEHSH